jgi:cell filamentation protein
MNGQRILQNRNGEEWVTAKVSKAGQIKPGVYNLMAAVAAELGKTYDGAILHADASHVYQQTGKAVVRHDADRFAECPEVGTQLTLKDNGDRILAVPTETKRSRSMRR